VHEVVAHDAAGDRLDGDADAAVLAGAVGQGVGAPEADAVDVDADPDVLPRHVAGPVAARLDEDRGGLGRLRGHRDDPALQAVAAAAQRVEDVEDVAELEGRHGGLGHPAQALPQVEPTGSPCVVRRDGDAHGSQCAAPTA